MHKDKRCPGQQISCPQHVQECFESKHWLICEKTLWFPCFPHSGRAAGIRDSLQFLELYIYMKTKRTENALSFTPAAVLFLWRKILYSHQGFTQLEWRSWNVRTQQDRQCTCNVILRRVYETIVVLEKKRGLYICMRMWCAWVSACAPVCVCVHRCGCVLARV